MTRSSPSGTAARVKALDLFAGTGWGVACQRLGIKEAGVEIMPEAVETRAANGMETIYRDVWDGLQLTAERHRELYGPYGLLIASPPCQTFSMAGNGKGREALNEVIEAIELHAYKDAEALRAFGEKHDPRTALVLTPLAYVWRDRPKLVAMEQVPTVLPVWEACADVMREWGYEVKVEVLNAEQYGVPQTRKRAILVARRSGPVHLPQATHSRYYSRTPGKLDDGVLKWVSMAEALGWGFGQRPAVTVGNAVGRGLIGGSGAKESVVHAIDGGSFIASPHGDGTDYANQTRITVNEAATLQSYRAGITFTQNNKQAHQAHRTLDQPAPTVTAGHDSGNRGFIDGDNFKVATPEEVAALQSYPARLRSNYGTGGDASNRGERTVDQPAPTLTSKADRNKWDGNDNMSANQAATLQSYPAVFRNGNQAHAAHRGADQPAPTIAFGHNSNRVEWLSGEQVTKVTAAEAGTLQTYEKPFVWCGTKTKQFLQIGNAVPPLLAEHILAALIGIRPGR